MSAPSLFVAVIFPWVFSSPWPLKAYHEGEVEKLREREVLKKRNWNFPSVGSRPKARANPGEKNFFAPPSLRARLFPGCYSRAPFWRVEDSCKSVCIGESRSRLRLRETSLVWTDNRVFCVRWTSMSVRLFLKPRAHRKMNIVRRRRVVGCFEQFFVHCVRFIYFFCSDVYVCVRKSKESVPMCIFSEKYMTQVIWLILPVVICLSQRLSHACLSTSHIKVKPRMAH